MIAYILSITGKKSPKAMSDIIASLSLKGALSDIRTTYSLPYPHFDLLTKGITADGTPNDLAQNDIPQNITLTR